jgi:membrane-associated phospholipid phosphatase
MRRLIITLATALLMLPSLAFAGGGPLGIDHKLHYDNHGIWKRSVQKDFQVGLVATTIGGAFLLGDHNRLGDTFWRSFDALAVSAASAQALKWGVGRKRPSQTNNPNDFFNGPRYQSFPSGEVTAVTAVVTPFMVRYGSEHPAVYALAALPVYDAIARMKTHGHWQTDVLAGAALGGAVGYWASQRQHSLLVGWLPGGFSVGYVKHF